MSSAARNTTPDPKKKLNYNPLRPGYNPLRPQSQQNSRNASSASIGSEIQKDASKSDMIHNAKTIYNPSTNSTNNSTTSEDPHKTIYIDQSNNEKTAMNQEEVDKLNEDINQLSKNINEHLQMSHNENGSTNNLNSNTGPTSNLQAKTGSSSNLLGSQSKTGSSSNLLGSQSKSGSSSNLLGRNPLAPSRNQSQTNVLLSSKPSSQAPPPSQPSSQAPPPSQPTSQAPPTSQSQNSTPAPASAPASAPAPAPAPAPAAASAPAKPEPSTQSNNANNNSSNDNGFDKLDPNTEVCVQPTNLTPDRSKPIYCEHCHEKIVGSILSSGKKFYHPRHFLCGGCNCELNGKPFFEVDEKPFCVNCYNNQHGVKCAFCNEFITGQYITALNKNWHPDHLRCSECNEPINSIIEEKDGKAYCHKDYQKLFGICCNKCHEPILSGGYITALDKPWHVDCFVCNVCNEPFTSTSFYEIDGFPYCSKHFEIASQCNFCKTKIVDNKRIKVGDLFYHPNHVFCTCCKKAISELATNNNENYNDLFKLTDNNVICKNCVASQTL